jgi:antirestriction protein ArdC
MFVCGYLRAPPAVHALYLGHRLKVMRAEKKAIFTAATETSQTTAFLAAREKTLQSRSINSGVVKYLTYKKIFLMVPR